MKFSIEGADAKTGADRSAILVASDELDAQRQAKERGILISSMRVIKEPVQIAPAVQSAPSVPEYTGLTIASKILFVYAVLCYVVGLMGCIFCVYSLFEYGGKAAAGGVVAALISLVGVLVVGGILHGCSAACVALRDIAQNSFKRA